MMILKVLYRIANCDKPLNEPPECEQKIFSEVPLTSGMIRQMIAKHHGYGYVVSISSIEPVAGAFPDPTVGMEYRIVEACSLDALEADMRLAIVDGWRPFGGLAVVGGGKQEYIFYQAMTREEGTVSKGGA